VAVIDGVFYVPRACDKQTRNVSVVTLGWIETVGGYNTADIVVKDEKTN